MGATTGRSDTGRLAQARLYGILDSGYVPPNRWVEVCQALLRGGVDLIQVRAKKESACERERLLERVLPLFGGADTPPLIVNDDLDLALRYPGVGLHIGQDDTPPEEARALLGRDRLLGWSTHSESQIEGAVDLGRTLDYFAIGPVFATGTKPEYPPVGTALLRWARAHAGEDWPPWFAIGGINRSTLGSVVAAGACRVVVVSALLCHPNPQAATRELADLLQAHADREGKGGSGDLIRER